MIAQRAVRRAGRGGGPVDGVEYVVWDGAEPPPRDDIELVVLDYRNARMTLERLDALPALAVVQTQTAGVDGHRRAAARRRAARQRARRPRRRDRRAGAGADHRHRCAASTAAVREHGHWQPASASSAAWPTATSPCWATARSAGPWPSGCSPAGPWSRRSRRRLATTTSSAGSSTAADVDWAAQHVVVVVLPADRRRPATSSTRRSWPGSPTARSWSTSAAARCSTPPPCSPRPAGCGSPSTSPTPSRCPTATRSGRRPASSITPHVAGGTTAMLPRMAALLRDQLTATSPASRCATWSERARPDV